MAGDKPDVFRDTWVRYLGYANELGESFKALVPRWAYLGSYAVASAYVLADAADKGTTEHKRSLQLPVSEQRLRTTVAVVDTALWQAFASVIIPGFIINRVCAATTFSLAKFAPGLRLNARKVAATAAGLCAIPLIVHPIDTVVEMTMDNTFRPLARSYQYSSKQNR